jgi:hypothetical protein
MLSVGRCEITYWIAFYNEIHKHWHFSKVLVLFRVMAAVVSGVGGEATMQRWCRSRSRYFENESLAFYCMFLHTVCKHVSLCMFSCNCLEIALRTSSDKSWVVWCGSASDWLIVSMSAMSRLDSMYSLLPSVFDLSIMETLHSATFSQSHTSNG